VFGVLTLASAALSASLQTTPPVLPRLALDSYPAPARATLSRIYQEAAAHPDSVRAVGALARMLHAWELWDPAHQAYERAQSLDPQGFEWRYLDAIVLQRLARHAEAAVQLRLAVAQQPTNLPARVKLAEALLESGDLEESKRLFTALVAEPAATPAAEVGLGRIAAAEGKHADAIARFQRAVALFPELGAAYYGLALSYRALGRQDEARSALERHARYGARWPALPDAALATVTDLREDGAAMLQRGVKLADGGDVAGAIAAHEAALVRDPDLTQAHANLIALYGRNRDWSKAEEHYRAVVRAGVSLADAHYDYGVLLALQEKWEGAAAAYREALAVNPLHVNAHNNLGQALERLGELPKAADAYRAALAVQPGFRLARFNLGRMLIALGRPDDAAGELAKIVEPRDAEAPRYLFALGVAHVRAGRKDEGINWSIEARKLALQYGQTDLATAIDRELAALK
jgi:tetratricopeptide (TPR) repeat protein